MYLRRVLNQSGTHPNVLARNMRFFTVATEPERLATYSSSVFSEREDDHGSKTQRHRTAAAQLHGMIDDMK